MLMYEWIVLLAKSDRMGSFKLVELGIVFIGDLFGFRVDILVLETIEEKRFLDFRIEMKFMVTA